MNNKFRYNATNYSTNKVCWPVWRARSTFIYSQTLLNGICESLNQIKTMCAKNCLLRPLMVNRIKLLNKWKKRPIPLYPKIILWNKSVSVDATTKRHLYMYMYASPILERRHYWIHFRVGITWHKKAIPKCVTVDLLWSASNRCCYEFINYLQSVRNHFFWTQIGQEWEMGTAIWSNNCQ